MIKTRHRLPLLACLVALSAATLSAQQTPPPTLETITVSSEGQFEANPDTAVLQFDVRGQNRQLRNAYSQAQQQAEQVRRLLRNNGIAAESAQLGTYQVQPDYDERTHALRNYIVSAALTVELTDFSKVAPLVDQAGQQGVTPSQNVSFILKNMDAAKARAIRDGYEKARNEAEVLAQAAGRRLGALTYATVDVSEPIRPMYAGAMAATARAAPTEQFTPAKITVGAQIHAIFRLQ